MNKLQPSLFQSCCEIIPIDDGELTLYPEWLPAAQSGYYFKLLQQQIAWEQSTIFVYGRTIKIPRLNAWYGDPGCDYQYSGRCFEPLPWLPVLQEINEALEQTLDQSFNSVLVNCYRDGNDSVCWHSDDEPELGTNPLVASVSLGEQREFQLRHRYNQSVPTKKINLCSGSLLLMAGALQHNWQHQLPKTKRSKRPRINLTFRNIITNQHS